MNRHANARSLALFSSGDLEGRKGSAVAAHVATCAECRARAGEFRSVEASLASWTAEPSEDDLRRVRETIARQITVPQIQSARRLWFAFGAASILLLLIFNMRQSVEPPLRLDTSVIELPRLQLPAFRLVPRRERIRKASRFDVAGVRNVSLENGVLKMTTADPNVVIYLSAEERSAHETN